MGAAQDVEEFLKSSVTKAYIEREKRQRVAAGAVICDVKETETHWIITTVWPG